MRDQRVEVAVNELRDLLGYHYPTQWDGLGCLPCVFWAVDRNGSYEDPVEWDS